MPQDFVLPSGDDHVHAVGGKALALSRLVEFGFRVPAFAVVSADRFRSVLTEPPYRDLKDEFDRRVVSKFDLIGAAGALQKELAHHHFAPGELDRLAAALSEAGITAPYAVRSSAVFEDLAERSFAGAYDSVLRVEPERVGAAIAACWASLYGLRAVLTLSDASSDLHAAGADLSQQAMAVIIQDMVRADAYGVCFSADPVTGNASFALVEAASSPGALVAGEVEPLRAVFDKATGRRLSLEVPDDVEPRAVRAFEASSAQILGIARRAEDHFGCPQDIEWAATADDVWVLQARPVVRREAHRDILEETRIVHADDDPDAAKLVYGDCEGIRVAYERKKFPFRRACRAGDVPLPAWYWIEWSAESLATTEDLAPLFSSTHVWIDLSSNLRALHVRTNELSAYLMRLADAHPLRHLTALVRESWDVTFGAVSVRDDAGNVMIEYCRGMLKGVLNGVVEPSHYWVGADGTVLSKQIAAQASFLTMDEETNEVVERPMAAPGCAELSDDVVERIGRGTVALAAQLGEVRPEWWIVDGKAMVFDVSVEQERFHEAGVSVLSPGRAEGRVLRIDDLSPLDGLGDGWAVSTDGLDQRMLELDGVRQMLDRARVAKAEGPVVLVASRPHVGLIALVDHVDGCVFGFCSMLSHLALVLRERGIPAIADASAVERVVDGSWVSFDPSGVVAR